MNKRLFRDLKKSIQQAKDIQSGKLRPRRTWIVSPVTKVKPNKKVYDRNLSKKEVKNLLTEDY